jgi:hypothetical protein
MNEQSLHRPLRHRAISEVKLLVALSVYLYVCLGAVELYKTAVLSEVGIAYTFWGVAVVKAVVLAKFMMLGRMLKVGQRYRNRPLIWPTLYHALIYLVVLLLLTTAEELVVGFIHGRAVVASLDNVVGSSFFQGFAVCLLMFLVLVPYSAFTCLGNVVGEGELARLFFVDRAVDDDVRDRLTGRLPPHA